MRGRSPSASSKPPRTYQPHETENVAIYSGFNSRMPGWFPGGKWRIAVLPLRVQRRRPTLKRIDVYVIRWARRKFKRLRHQTKGARDWFAQLRCANPKLFAHWQLCHGNGRTMGAV